MPKRHQYRPRRRQQSLGSVLPARFWLAIGCLVVAVAGIAYVLLFSPLFRVSKVTVSGTQATSADEVSAFVKDRSQRQYGPIVSNSVAVADTEGLAAQTKEHFGDLAKVEVTKKWPNSLQVTIIERQQALLWQSGPSYYLVDKQGIAFQRSDPRGDLVSVVDSTGLPVEVGKPVVGAGFIKVLDQIQQGMTGIGMPITQFRVPETTFEIQAVTKDGWYALFDTTRAVDGQIQGLQQAISTGKPKQYADLRVPGRVYIR